MENTAKKSYQKPEIQVIVINNESPLLASSSVIPSKPTQGKDMPVG